jgi:CHAD domain-containing protein
MPRFEKWLVGVSPDTAADEVARRAVAERLLAVSHFLDKSLGGGDEAEAIHQLRVWTRRAGAALKLFAPAIPNARRKQMQKTLRKLRGAAGMVRDCDVQLTLLESDHALPQRVVRALKKQRRRARRQLQALRRRWRKDDRLALEMERLIDKIAWPKRHSSRTPPPFGTFGRQALEPLAREFFQWAEADLNNEQALHTLRIAGKRLRYALELVPALLTPSTHRRLYDSLDEIQDRFGEVHDQLTMCSRINDWQNEAKQKRHERKLVTLLRREQQRLKSLHRVLLRWWSPTRRQRLARLWKQALSAS